MTAKRRRDDSPPEESGVEEEAVYWVLRGSSGCFYDCASFRDVRYTALCVFDSREAAEANSRSLDENELFLNTLELYGPLLPACVRREPMVPAPVRVSAVELWEIIEALGLGYVTINPPQARQKVESFKLHPATAFKPA